jgi:putative FmdB family regulatory protein
VAENRNARFHLDHSLFGRWQLDLARQKKSSQGLHVPASQPRARPEASAHELSRLVSQTVLELGFWSWRLQASLLPFAKFPQNDSNRSSALHGSDPMPIFEYVCQECQHEFETLIFGRDKAKCPKCQSGKLSPQLSVFAVAAKGSTGATSATSGCGSCGDPRGPGACSLGDMD